MIYGINYHVFGKSADVKKVFEAVKGALANEPDYISGAISTTPNCEVMGDLDAFLTVWVDLSSSKNPIPKFLQTFEAWKEFVEAINNGADKTKPMTLVMNIFLE